MRAKGWTERLAATVGLAVGACLFTGPARSEPKETKSAAVRMSVEGRVVNPDGTPCLRCKVRAVGPQFSFHTTTSSGKDGTFRLRGIPAGKYRLSAENSAGEPAFLPDHSTAITVDEGTNVRGVEIVAPPLSGREPKPPLTPDCGGMKPCFHAPCDPSRPCCKAFSLEIPEGARLTWSWSLSLTAAPDGTVTGGEVVTSSGNAALDELLLEKFIENSCFEPSERPTILTFGAKPHASNK
jgi:hypothetical protein